MNTIVYLLRGFPFLFVFFLLFLVFHELLFPFLILLSVEGVLHNRLFMLDLNAHKLTHLAQIYS